MESRQNPESMTDLIISANNALICEVRPNMREISFEYLKEEKRFILYLFYDQHLTQEEENYDVAGTIISKISRNFPDSHGVNWEKQIIVLPYPGRLPHKGISVYLRYEPVPKEFSNDSDYA